MMFNISKCLFLVAVIAFGLGCSTSKKQEKAELHLQIGTGFLNKGNYPAALRELLAAEELAPDHAIVQNNLGIAYYVRGHFPQAEQHLRKAVEIDPLYTDALNNLGRVHIEMGKYDLAIEELHRVTADLTYSNPEKAYTNLGLAYMKAKNYKLARKNILEAMKIDRSFCPAHNYYGQIYFMEEAYEKASQVLDSAIQICKNLDEAHYYNALSHARLGNREKAVARMKEVVQLYPGSQYADKARSFLETNKE